MDHARLAEALKAYRDRLSADRLAYERDRGERRERIAYYQGWTADRIRSMSEDDLYEYFGKLWAMLIWGNKKYAVDKLIDDNSIKKLKAELVELIWGQQSIAVRWDHFRREINGMGPAMTSEILCHTHPMECMLWNRRTCVGFRKLGVESLPRYNYQVTGERYVELSSIGKRIAEELERQGFEETDLLAVDYFIWHELQGDEELGKAGKKAAGKEAVTPVSDTDAETSIFIHNEVRDKLADIGVWLGFTTGIEKKVAEGSVVDAVWEATIGNMGRVIYVFEVQTKGSIDSLIVNLLKSLNNPAVQGVVAVSDPYQIEKIKKHAAGVAGLADKLKYWNYEEVLEVHESLEGVNAAINSLGLVPQGF